MAKKKRATGTRIGTRPAYLQIRSRTDHAEPEVGIRRGLQDVVHGWGAGTRISPVWGLSAFGTETASDLSFEGKWSLLFLGPVSLPQLLFEINPAADPDVQAWVTLGMFNAIFSSVCNARASDTLVTIQQWAADRNVPCEMWSVENGLVKSWTAQHTHESGDLTTIERLGKLAGQDMPGDIELHIQEFVALAASSLCRAAQTNKDQHSHLISVADAIISDIEESDPDAGMLDLSATLFNVNAALSRFSSQAYSGISPILRTECHFWIHSLLGIGSANLALHNLTKFISNRLGNAYLAQRIERLRYKPFEHKDFNAMRLDKSFLSKDYLFDIDLGAELPEIDPVITYYSGRDGYSSQLITLSAPLTALAQANSFHTNILTVTHEISHIFVEGILSELYPNPDDAAEIASLTRIVTEERQPENLFEAAQKFLVEALSTMESLRRGVDWDNANFTAEDVRDMVVNWRREAKEIVVHTFDYLYFFDNSEQYITAIWSTWCGIPGIQERIPEYILRTLCAVCARDINSPATVRRERAKAQLELVLKRLIKGDNIPGYAQLALEYLNQKWEPYSDQLGLSRELDARLDLVKLVYGFFYSQGIAASLFRDPKAGVSKTKRILDTKPIGNPLTFVQKHLNKKPSSAEAVWLLQSVAFGLEAYAAGG